MKHLPLITTSELRAFRRCAREHHLAYREGFRPLETAGALRFGTLIHLGLEAWWRALLAGGDPFAAAMAAIAGEADPFDRARASALLTGYHARWAEERASSAWSSTTAVARASCWPPDGRSLSGRP